ncbi:Catechol 1 [Escovopsis weberi]|uniref:Catechol 1 n=1 Tax=Escovopsis weberi TaxID=150374 RepID=A0A0M9VWD6_ESCWE|nr:Catechol 1 [Escovopsis weberi]
MGHDEQEGLGQAFTQGVIDSMGPGTNPRLRFVMASFIQHIHDFAREVDLTMDEWLMGVELINQAGRMSDGKRNEGQTVCDVIGLESLVDDITFRLAAKGAARAPTESSILGPFWRADTPVRENGTTISFDTPEDGEIVYMHGRVTGADGAPLPNATVDIWEASTNGLYEQQDPNQVDCNLRGKFITDAEGRYSMYCLRPTAYGIPHDGPSWELLRLMDRHEMRPAHIHLMVSAPGHRTLITQIYDKDSKYLDSDATFAVKNSLVVKFQPREKDPRATLELEHNIQLIQDA